MLTLASHVRHPMTSSREAPWGGGRAARGRSFGPGSSSPFQGLHGTQRDGAEQEEGPSAGLSASLSASPLASLSASHAGALNPSFGALVWLARHAHGIQGAASWTHADSAPLSVVAPSQEMPPPRNLPRDPSRVPTTSLTRTAGTASLTASLIAQQQQGAQQAAQGRDSVHMQATPRPIPGSNIPALTQEGFPVIAGSDSGTISDDPLPAPLSGLSHPSEAFAILLRPSQFVSQSPLQPSVSGRQPPPLPPRPSEVAQARNLLLEQARDTFAGHTMDAPWGIPGHRQQPECSQVHVSASISGLGSSALASTRGAAGRNEHAAQVELAMRPTQRRRTSTGWASAASGTLTVSDPLPVDPRQAPWDPHTSTLSEPTVLRDSLEAGAAAPTEAGSGPDYITRMGTGWPFLAGSMIRHARAPAPVAWEASSVTTGERPGSWQLERLSSEPLLVAHGMQLLQQHTQLWQRPSAPPHPALRLPNTGGLLSDLRMASSGGLLSAGPKTDSEAQGGLGSFQRAPPAAQAAPAGPPLFPDSGVPQGDPQHATRPSKRRWIPDMWPGHEGECSGGGGQGGTATAPLMSDPFDSRPRLLSDVVVDILHSGRQFSGRVSTGSAFSPRGVSNHGHGPVPVPVAVPVPVSGAPQQAPAPATAPLPAVAVHSDSVDPVAGGRERAEGPKAWDAPPERRELQLFPGSPEAGERGNTGQSLSCKDGEGGRGDMHEPRDRNPEPRPRGDESGTQPATREGGQKEHLVIFGLALRPRER